MSHTKHSTSPVIYQKEQLMEMQDLVNRRLNGEVAPLDLVSLRRNLGEDAGCKEKEKGDGCKGPDKRKVMRIDRGNSMSMIRSRSRDKPPDPDTSYDDISLEPAKPHTKKPKKEPVGASKRKALANHHQPIQTSPPIIFNPSADDSDSPLSDTSNISDLCPTSKKPRLTAPPKPTKTPPQNPTSASRYQTRAKHLSTLTTLFSPPSSSLPNSTTTNHKSLHHTLHTLPFDPKPTDRPPWITGLRKPLPHASLSPTQNLDIKIRLYDDEIARLMAIREKLQYCIPDGGEGGEWRYEHWGATFDVQLGRSKGQVFARGMWRFLGEEGGRRACLLDEWPRDVWGEPLGWGFRSGDWGKSGGEEEGVGYSSDEE